MKKKLLIISMFIYLALFNVNAQETKPQKEEKVKTTWTGNGFFHMGFRPGSWEADKFAAVTESGTLYKSGAKGSNTPFYLSVDQITKYVYWNMDLSMMFGKRKYDYTQNQSKSFFDKGYNPGKYQTVLASFLGAVGYLHNGRYGGYIGYRIGYDNNLIKFNQGTSISSFGGQKKGVNFHFLVPIWKTMLRISFYNDQLKNGEANFKAKTRESEFNLYFPFNKSKSSGLMLRYNKMKFSTTDYSSGLKTLNGGAALNYKRSYFQIGFIIPIFKDLAPDDCLTCKGSGRVKEFVESEKCTACNGSGGKTCGSCGGGGRIYSQDRTNSNYCSACGGSGSSNCVTCVGTGRIGGNITYKTCTDCKGRGKIKK